MGTYTVNNVGCRPKDVKMFLDKENTFTNEDTGARHFVIKSCIRHFCEYHALCRIETDKISYSYITSAKIHLNPQGDNFSYKPMDEFAGPCLSYLPRSYVEAATSLKEIKRQHDANGSSLGNCIKWADNYRKSAMKIRPKLGDVVKYEDYFITKRRGHRNHYYMLNVHPDTGEYYKADRYPYRFLRVYNTPNQVAWEYVGKFKGDAS